MEFSIKALSPEKKKTGCLVLGVWQEAVLTRSAQNVDKAASGRLVEVLEHGDLSGRAGSTLLLHAVPGVAAERVLLVGLGEQKEFGETAFREAIRTCANALKNLGATDAVLALADLKVARRDLAWNVRHAVAGIGDAFYRFDSLKTQKKAPPPVLRAVAGSTCPYLRQVPCRIL